MPISQKGHFLLWENESFPTTSVAAWTSCLQKKGLQWVWKGTLSGVSMQWFWSDNEQELYCEQAVSWLEKCITGGWGNRRPGCFLRLGTKGPGQLPEAGGLYRASRGRPILCPANHVIAPSAQWPAPLCPLTQCADRQKAATQPSICTAW